MKIKIFKWGYLILGLLLLINGIYLTFVVNFNLGLLAQLLVSVVLVVCAFFLDKLSKFLFIKIVFNVLLILFLIFCLTLFLFGINNSVEYDEDVLIVLGAGLDGEEVSNNLAKRLNKAIEYYQKNPSASIIVSGGRGDDEAISEALAMERYLIAKGVPREAITKEDRSTSTIENFLYSSDILSEKFSKKPSVVLVTNDFHILRSCLVARSFGIEANHISATTTWYTVPMVYLRELIAYLKYYIL